MKKKNFIVCILVGYLFTASLCQASWLIYHKPEFKGKIIDAETKEPIEGVVVAVYYQKSTIGGIEPIIHFAETLTDRNGDFVIPPFKTIIHPLANESRADFIIYKPGYVFASEFDPERFFSPEKSGQSGTVKSKGQIEHFTYGVGELRKLKTREERIRSLQGIPACCSSKEFPLLYQSMNEEWRSLGMEGER